METELEQVLPADIERRSFEIIRQELGARAFPPQQEPIILRVIHTTADFDYAENLHFSPGAVEAGIRALQEGACIVTDTQMAQSGINRRALCALGAQARCFMGDEQTAAMARRAGITRASASMDRAAALKGPVIFAIGNAPTALIRLCELIRQGKAAPALVIGVPVGFVNVLPAKEMLEHSGVPYIVARGRKGGSTVAAAICNALLYQAGGREESVR